MRALLIGQKPDRDLGVTYETAPPFDTVVIGSLTLGQALVFANEQALSALAEGKPVLCYEPGFPVAPGSRPLSTALASAKRNMKNLGIVFVSGAQKRLITAETAQEMKRKGQHPPPGSVLTPLAKEILGSDGKNVGTGLRTVRKNNQCGLWTVEDAGPYT